jgi:carbon dioxide concentrating mechanism protein CcmN
MLLQPLHSVNYSDFHVSGDVTIHPNVAIAPGVLIQADPDSQIIIESGTCIGTGTIIHASKGVIEIKAGVTIGTGVLIVGAVIIGANACIGSMTTVFNQAIPSAELVLAGSLLVVGDRQAKTLSAETLTKVLQSPSPQISEGTKDSFEYKEPYKTTLVIESTSDRAETSIVIKESIKGSESSPQVYGQENLNRLLAKLLPHRQALNRPLNNNQNNIPNNNPNDSQN